MLRPIIAYVDRYNIMAFFTNINIVNIRVPLLSPDIANIVPPQIWNSIQWFGFHCVHIERHESAVLVQLALLAHCTAYRLGGEVVQSARFAVDGSGFDSFGESYQKL